MQPLQPHLHRQKRNAVFRYRPFLVSFILNFIFIFASIGLFVQTTYVCGNNCLTYYSFYYSCERGGALYCCSYSQYTAPDRCGTSFASCYLDNTVCGTYRNLAIGSGVLWFVSWICLMIFSCRFRRMQQMILQAQMNQVNHQPYINNQAYPNNNNYPAYPNNNNYPAYPNNNYPAYPNNNGNPYAQQPALNNPYQNNQYQNNTYNQPIAYIPPPSNAINRQ